MDRFAKKRVIITGAGSGFGRALALEFAGNGWNVAVTDIDEAKAGETLGLVVKASGQGLAARCDVSRYENLEALAGLLEREWGGVDVLVNNAGVAVAGFMEETPLEDWDWIFGINLKGVIHGCRAFIPVLDRQGGGHIINVASAAGFVSMPEMASYNVTKAGVISLSETLKAELSIKNIGVSVVAPTFFKTNLLDTMRAGQKRGEMIARNLTDKSETTAEDVARDTYRAMLKNRFYVISMRQARGLWRFKRLFPERYLRFMAKRYSRGDLDKAFGLGEEHLLTKVRPGKSK